MNIIIAGDGEVGFHLAKMLSNNDHNITIVDPDQELIKMVESQSEALAITGDSTSIEVLEQAKVKKADLMISVLHDERINIVTSVLAKKLGAKRCIARITNPEYLTPHNKQIFKALGIDAIVSPESLAAKEIGKLLRNPAATEIFDFSEGLLSLFLLKLDSKALILNKTLDNIAAENEHLDFRAIAIHRDSKTIIPRGNDQFLENDMTYIITKPEGINEMLRLGGKDDLHINTVMIAGGGRIGKLTALLIEKEMAVKLIDNSLERCNKLAAILTNTMIIHGDIRNLNLLEEEGIKQTDAFVAVTEQSETNILSCLLAKKYGIKRTIALVENIDYIDVSQRMGIDTIINKKLIAASYISRFTLRANVASIKCLHGVDAEVLEFIVKSDAWMAGKQIKDMEFPAGAIIGGIVRGQESFIALGNLVIHEGDKLVVFAIPSVIKKVEKIFSK
ncbi:MAG: Trk system potassium transport protein TrkA [Bacteroidetes bacterium RIFOXYA12_FULL_35_11]|nr:MAG: Trk system potassium transport protein TrkA [Bacteroidetes bacterium GWF2_35_48]OFY73688.1 MAG: Trk system potassium transport protein TrkA [Bacteroidetes bacterium RIFOXYA12_FULL_35_11]OFY96711.1 MAG: Trk system potassium transport protein TrkA [Bacteroidetes bacterium RIFOXYB2_FULL_35_7]OFZ04233.1 MAG: Trk system potassium transport protein TrkA [Bacteroidetes bacterium RIFOXYC12_FULL_35_7]HBX52912.1 Trk system potassium transporter TrkA [Bacteroidales bacterium]